MRLIGLFPMRVTAYSLVFSSLFFSTLAISSNQTVNPPLQHCHAYLADRSTSGVDSFEILPVSNFGPAFAVQGLDRLFELPNGPKLAFRLLRRLGLVRPTKEDPNFAPLFLFANNKNAIAANGHEDALVQRYLRHLYRGERSRKLIGFSQKRTEIMRTAFWRLINEVNETQSRKALSWVGGEIESQYSAYQESRLTQNEFEQNVILIIESISSSSIYLKRKLPWVPHFLVSWLSMLPLVGPLLETGEYAIRSLLERNRDLNQFRRDDSEPHPGYEPIEGTTTFSIENSDPLGLRKKARDFILGQLQVLRGDSAKVAPHTPHYTNALEEAYPDLMAIRHAPVISVRSSYRVPGAWQRYGMGNYESDKATQKIILFFAVLLNQKEHFPDMTPTVFSGLRRQMLSTLKLTETIDLRFLKLEHIDIEAVDRALSFILSENIGRSLASNEVAISEAYGIWESSDQFLRLLRRLRHYPVASLYRQEPNERNALVQALQMQAKADPGKMKQGELSAFALIAAEGSTPYQIALVCFRSVLSHAAIATLANDKQDNSTNFTDLDWWAYALVQTALLEVAGKPGDNSAESYQTMLETFSRWQKQPNFVAHHTRLAMLLRSVGSGAPNFSRELLAWLPEDRYREIMSRFLLKYPVDLHQFAELFGAIKRKVSEQAAGQIWIMICAKIFQWVEEDENFQNAVRKAHQERELVRINVYSLVRYVESHPPTYLLEENKAEVRMVGGQYRVTMPRDR